MPGVSAADGFALIYLKYLCLWTDAGICKKVNSDEKKIYFYLFHKGREAQIHDFDLISMVFQATSLTSHRGDIDKYAHV